MALSAEMDVQHEPEALTQKTRTHRVLLSLRFVWPSVWLAVTLLPCITVLIFGFYSQQAGIDGYHYSLLELEEGLISNIVSLHLVPVRNLVQNIASSNTAGMLNFTTAASNSAPLVKTLYTITYRASVSDAYSMRHNTLPAGSLIVISFANSSVVGFETGSQVLMFSGPGPNQPFSVFPISMNSSDATIDVFAGPALSYSALPVHFSCPQAKSEVWQSGVAWRTKFYFLYCYRLPSGNAIAIAIPMAEVSNAIVESLVEVNNVSHASFSYLMLGPNLEFLATNSLFSPPPCRNVSQCNSSDLITLPRITKAATLTNEFSVSYAIKAMITALNLSPSANATQMITTLTNAKNTTQNMQADDKSKSGGGLLDWTFSVLYSEDSSTAQNRMPSVYVILMWPADALYENMRLNLLQLTTLLAVFLFFTTLLLVQILYMLIRPLDGVTKFLLALHIRYSNILAYMDPVELHVHFMSPTEKFNEITCGGQTASSLRQAAQKKEKSKLLSGGCWKPMWRIKVPLVTEMRTWMETMKTLFGLFLKLEQLVPETVRQRITTRVPKADELDFQSCVVVHVSVSVLRFGELVESMSVERVTQFMSMYFEHILNAAKKQEAATAQLSWESMDFVYTARSNDEHTRYRLAVAGLLLARALDRAVKSLSAQLNTHGLPRINASVVVNLGSACVGNVGSEDTMVFSVIGNTVRCAPVLHRVARHFGVKVLATDDVIRAAIPEATSIKQTTRLLVTDSSSTGQHPGSRTNAIGNAHRHSQIATMGSLANSRAGSQMQQASLGVLSVQSGLSGKYPNCCCMCARAISKVKLQVTSLSQPVYVYEIIASPRDIDFQRAWDFATTLAFFYESKMQAQPLETNSESTEKTLANRCKSFLERYPGDKPALELLGMLSSSPPQQNLRIVYSNF